MSHLAKAVPDHGAENPAGNAVSAPTDPVLQAKDVDRKMKLYGVIEALREGNYPSNRQIDHALSRVLHSPAESHTLSKLSKEGRMLVQDALNIVKTVRRVVHEKNGDEAIQEFLFATRRIDTSRANVKGNVNTPVSGDELKGDGEQALEHLRTLGKLIVTNGEFRKLLKDISILGRDVAADAAVTASSKLRPDDKQLSQVDQTAPSNEWVGPDGERRGHNDSVPSTGLGSLRDQAQAYKDDVKSEAQDHGAGAKDRLQSTTESAADSGHHQTDADRAAAGSDAFGQQAKDEASRLRDKVSSRIPQEHKDLAKDQYHQAKNYANDKFPAERRDRFIYRLKKVVVENQRHTDYQDAVEFFLDKAETYSTHATNVASDSGSQGLKIRDDKAYQHAESLLRKILERFANGASMQPIFDAVNQIYTDVEGDPELRKWFSELGSYVREVLQTLGYIMKESSDREGRRLLESSKRFFDPKEGKYSGHKDALFDSITSFFTNYADDPINQQLGLDVKKLTKDLLMDGDGNLKYKHHLWTDVRSVLLPSLIANGGYLPIPRIEYTDKAIDVVIENLTLQIANLIPNVVDIDIRNRFKVSPSDAVKDTSTHSFTVSWTSVQADLKDVRFYINKKTGFPKLQDSGAADVLISGKGISGVISLQSSGRKDHAFKVNDVKIKIDKLKFAIRGAKHSFLINSFRILAGGLIKKAVAKAIEEGIRSALVQLDGQLSDIAERLDEAKDNDDVSTLDVIKSTFDEKKEEAAQTKEAVTPAGQFQITAKRDSRLVNWTSPGSIIEKQGEAQDRANDRQGWKSSAFDVEGEHHGKEALHRGQQHAGQGGVAGVGAGGLAGDSGARTGAGHEVPRNSSLAAEPQGTPTRSNLSSATPLTAHSTVERVEGYAGEHNGAPHLAGRTQ